MRYVSFLLLLMFGIALASYAQLVQIGPPGPNSNYCQDEEISPNLLLLHEVEIGGQIRFQSEPLVGLQSEPLAHSKVALQRYVSKAVQTPVTAVETDGTGHFSLGPVQPGIYRLLASPARWAAQPEKLDCPAAGECRLDIVLKINGTDLPFSDCPIR
jgi:hypothetical protein